MKIQPTKNQHRSYMQMYALACNTSSNVVKRTTESLINAHCLSSLAEGFAVVVDSGWEFIAFVGSVSSSGVGSELPGVATPVLVLELQSDGKAVYAI